MRVRPLLLPVLVSISLVLVACGSGPDAGGVGALTSSDARDDDGAMADLQESDDWTSPRCRWLETGAWVLAWPQETALLKAAHDLGYIELEEVGQDNRIGTPEPAWKVALTEAGKTEAAECPPSSKSTVWGLPVSRREFISGTHQGKDYGGRTIYEVEFDWVPTEAGERVKKVLTGNMAVEEGTYRARVYVQSGPGIIGGPNGWHVSAINDLDAVRQ